MDRFPCTGRYGHYSPGAAARGKTKQHATTLVYALDPRPRTAVGSSPTVGRRPENGASGRIRKTPRDNRRRLPGSASTDAGANSGSSSYLPGQARSAQVRDPEQAHRCRNILSPSRRRLWILASGSRIAAAFGGSSGKVGKGAPSLTDRTGLTRFGSLHAEEARWAVSTHEAGPPARPSSCGRPRADRVQMTRPVAAADDPGDQSVARRRERARGRPLQMYAMPGFDQ